MSLSVFSDALVCWWGGCSEQHKKRLKEPAGLDSRSRGTLLGS